MSASRFAGKGIIAFHAGFLDIAGVDHLSSLFMSQCLYWQDVKDRKAPGAAWYHSLEEWAVELRITRKQLDRCRKVWRNLGVLIEGRRGGFDNTKTYRVDHARLDALLPGPGGKFEVPPSGDYELPLEGHIGVAFNGHISSETTSETTAEITKDSRPAGAGGACSDEAFDAWWSEWSAIKGASRSKGLARRAWKTAVKKAKPELLIRRVNTYLNHCKASGTALQYIKHPSTWLNGECWDDDLGPTNGTATASGNGRQMWEVERDDHGFHVFSEAMHDGKDEAEARQMAIEARRSWQRQHKPDQPVTF